MGTEKFVARPAEAPTVARSSGLQFGDDAHRREVHGTGAVERHPRGEGKTRVLRTALLHGCPRQRQVDLPGTGLKGHRARARTGFGRHHLGAIEIEQRHGELVVANLPLKQPLDCRVEGLAHPHGPFRQAHADHHAARTRNVAGFEGRCRALRFHRCLFHPQRRHGVASRRGRQHPPPVDEGDLAPVGSASVDDLDARRHVGADPEIGNLAAVDGEIRWRRRGFLFEPLGREHEREGHVRMNRLRLHG